MTQYREERPWGFFEVLLDSEKTKVKRITVNPGGILSYQYHQKRSEHWIIIEGTACVRIEGGEKNFHAGESLYIPAGAKHQVSNRSDSNLVFVEVQVGTYFGEDDIIRLEDKYNRV
jgi:mannose-6-phosphate isomerase